MTISLTNSRNQTVNLTGDETKYQVISVTGLDPGKAVINTTTIAGVDGTRFNSARLPNRNIVINVKINGDAYQNRQDLYTKFPNKEQVTVSITTGQTATITGIVDSISCNIFDQKQIVQISLICDDPYFNGPAWTKTETWSGEMHSYSVTNSGIVETGFILNLDVDTQEASDVDIWLPNFGGLTIDVSSIEESAYRLIIDTIEKTIKLKIGAGVPIDYLHKLSLGSVFFHLPPGNSVIHIDTDSDQTDFTAAISIPNKMGGL